jgi:hypothetical protein
MMRDRIEHIIITFFISASPMHPSPENPVLDVAGCRREEAWLFHKVGYLPEVVVFLLGKVYVDNFGGMWTVVVNSRGIAGGWGRVCDFGRPFCRSTSLIKLQTTINKTPR